MDGSFAQACAATLRRPLTEVVPDAQGDHAAALGFALAWISLGISHGAADRFGPIYWAERDFGFQEGGLPHADGLLQFGLALDRLLVVSTANQTDALWATEQALTAPGATVLCAIAPSGGSSKKPLDLTATRRLLLAAEKHRTRCVLLRLDQAGTTAAWTRWRIAAAPSIGAGRELGPPTFDATIDRNRAGAAGQRWRLQWNAAAHDFAILPDSIGTAIPGAGPAAPVDRPLAPERQPGTIRRAG